MCKNKAKTTYQPKYRTKKKLPFMKTMSTNKLCFSKSSIHAYKAITRNGSKSFTKMSGLHPIHQNFTNFPLNKVHFLYVPYTQLLAVNC